MDNTKAKRIVIKIFVMLIVIVLACGMYWYLQNLSNKKQVLVYQPEEETPLDLSNPITEYVNMKQSMGKSTAGNYDLYIDIKLPQINATTKEAKSINNKIKAQYKEIKDYYSQDKKYASYEVSYEYKYLWTMRFMYITIKTTVIDEYEAKSGTKYFTYIYDEKNNKQVSMEDILTYFSASREKVISKIKLDSSFDIQLTELTDSLDIQKDLSIVSLDESNVTLRANIGKEEFLVTFSLNELNVAGLVTDDINEKKDIGSSKINIKIPEIKLETENVILLNSEMKKVYNNILTKIGDGGNGNTYKVNYQYGYSDKLSYMYININEVIQNTVDEKTTSTTKYITYIYDVSGDKAVTLEELFERYKVDYDEIVEQIIPQMLVKLEEGKIKEYVINKDNISIVSFDENEIKLGINISETFYEVNLKK